MSPGNKQHRLVRLALQASCHLEAILDRNPRVGCLVGEDKDSFEKGCWDLAACVSALGGHYHEIGIWLYHFTMKAHYLVHLGRDCGEVSPRLSWCYAGEDMMSKVKKLVQSSCRGTALHQIPNNVMRKYVVALSYMIICPDKWWR